MLASIALIYNSLYVKVRFLRNMQNTFDFSFLATVKNNLSVSYPGHKGGTVSLWKVNKGQAGLKQTVTRTVRKGLHTGITV